MNIKFTPKYNERYKHMNPKINTQESYIKPKKLKNKRKETLDKLKKQELYDEYSDSEEETEDKREQY